MALAKCEDCGKKISKRAENCPNCGAPNVSRSESSKADKPQKKTSKTKGCLGMIAMVIIGSFIFIPILIKYVGDDEDMRKRREESEASARMQASIKACEELIKENLKFPSTFKKPWVGAADIREDSKGMAIQIEFTSKNALGLELPSHGYCLQKGSNIKFMGIENR